MAVGDWPGFHILVLPLLLACCVTVFQQYLWVPIYFSFFIKLKQLHKTAVWNEDRVRFHSLLSVRYTRHIIFLEVSKTYMANVVISGIFSAKEKRDSCV